LFFQLGNHLLFFVVFSLSLICLGIVGVLIKNSYSKAALERMMTARKYDEIYIDESEKIL